MLEEQSKRSSSNNRQRRSYTAIVFVSFLLFASTFSLLYPHSTPPPNGKKRIVLEHADSLHYDAIEMPGMQQLKGNVKLRHAGWIMYCDSAFLEEETNSLFAYDNIRINEGDSITIIGQLLNYYGEDRIAQLRYNVELSNRTATLYTDSLDYDRNAGIAYYTEGGTIVDSLNTLSSVYGEYTPSTNEAVFRDEVVLENTDFTLNTDYLRYNTDTKIAYFNGPTTIVSDSGRIESTRGVYDTGNDVGIFLIAPSYLTEEALLQPIRSSTTNTLSLRKASAVWYCATPSTKRTFTANTAFSTIAPSTPLPLIVLGLRTIRARIRSIWLPIR